MSFLKRIVKILGSQGPPEELPNITVEGKPATAVTVKSPPERIVQNFIDSAYFLGLTDAQEAQARKDPTSWLEGHPYLFAWYPQFFVDVTGKVKPSKATVDAMRKH